MSPQLSAHGVHEVSVLAPSGSTELPAVGALIARNITGMGYLQLTGRSPLILIQGEQTPTFQGSPARRDAPPPVRTATAEGEEPRPAPLECPAPGPAPLKCPNPGPRAVAGPQGRTRRQKTLSSPWFTC